MRAARGTFTHVESYYDGVRGGGGGERFVFTTKWLTGASNDLHNRDVFVFGYKRYHAV